MQYQFQLIESASIDDTELQLLFDWPLYFRVGMRLLFPGNVVAIVSGAKLTEALPFVLPVVAMRGNVAVDEFGLIEVDDIARMMRYLRVSAGYKATFALHVNQYELTNPGTLRQVSEYLAELDALDAFAAEQGTDENLFLEKAGSLQWSVGGKAQAPKERCKDLIGWMVDALNADRFVGSSASMGVTQVINGYRR